MKGNLSRLKSIAAMLGKRNLTVTAAESCTGGGLAFEFTRVPGSSSWFKQSWVTYSEQSKKAWLGVSAAVLQDEGAVSEVCAAEMATCALKTANADFAISITGIAGPDGGSDSKPVGTVWIGFASVKNVQCFCFHFAGDRQQVRNQAIRTAILGVELWLHDRLSPDAFKDFHTAYQRVFLAAWPDVDMQTKLIAIQQQELSFLEKQHSADDFHMTLRFLGDLSLSEIETVKNDLQGLYWPQIALIFSQLAYWHHSEAWVLLPRQVPSVLLAAVGGIEARLAKLELPVDRRFFMPHITLGRGKGVDPDFSMEIEPVTLLLKDVSLAAARVNGTIKYQKLLTLTS